MLEGFLGFEPRVVKLKIILGRAERYHLADFNVKSDARFLERRDDTDITTTQNAILACDKRGQNHPTARGPKYVTV
jgi:hypothetical protein